MQVFHLLLCIKKKLSELIMMEDGLSSSIKQPSGSLVVVEHTVIVRKISDELTK